MLRVAYVGAQAKREIVDAERIGARSLLWRIRYQHGMPRPAMIRSGARWPPVQKSQADEFTEKRVCVLLDPASLLIVNFSEFVNYLVDSVDAVTHFPDRSAHLIDWDRHTGVFLKKQNSLVREWIGVNFRAAEKYFGAKLFTFRRYRRQTALLGQTLRECRPLGGLDHSKHCRWKVDQFPSEGAPADAVIAVRFGRKLS